MVITCYAYLIYHPDISDMPDIPFRMYGWIGEKEYVWNREFGRHSVNN